MTPEPSRPERFLQKRGGLLIFGYIFSALLPMFAYQSEFNAPFEFAFKYLSLPIAVVCLCVFGFLMPSFRAKNGTVKGAIVTLIISSMLILMSGGYVVLVNAWGPWQSDVIIEGRVVERHISHGRHNTSYLVTVMQRNEKQIKFDVSPDEYERLEIGQTYYSYWRIGSLGLLYK